MRIPTLALFCILAIPPAALAQGAPAPAPSPALVVHTKDFSYVPKDAKITVGDTVVFVNDDESAHTVTADDASFDSGYMAKDAKWSYTFTKAGTVPYYCVYHKFMRATVIVSEK
ncbi:MAG: cupredoxin family copper-binding protein [Candidatus Velthaea sp.]